jgi:hypothetical protein
MNSTQVSTQIGVSTTHWPQLALVPTEDLKLIGEKSHHGITQVKFSAQQPFLATDVLRFVGHSSFGDIWDFTFEGLRFHDVHLSLLCLQFPEKST